jgi:RNA-splicing ligase RtcB
MSETGYYVITPENGVPIKAWTKGVPLEVEARKQLLKVAQLPFIFKWVAAMPDVHWGIGATVGGVIPTKDAIIPAAVGVDIGCRMMAVQTELNARDLRSYIVRGKGNPESFTSCSHGAGRAMSRPEAKRRFSVADHERRTAGVEWRKDADVIDETPAAYKPIEAVMAAQTDLVEVVHTLRQVVCVKG